MGERRRMSSFVVAFVAVSALCAMLLARCSSATDSPSNAVYSFVGTVRSILHTDFPINRSTIVSGPGPLHSVTYLPEERDLRFTLRATERFVWSNSTSDLLPLLLDSTYGVNASAGIDSVTVDGNGIVMSCDAGSHPATFTIAGGGDFSLTLANFTLMDCRFGYGEVADDIPSLLRVSENAFVGIVGANFMGLRNLRLIFLEGTARLQDVSLVDSFAKINSTLCGDRFEDTCDGGLVLRVLGSGLALVDRIVVSQVSCTGGCSGGFGAVNEFGCILISNSTLTMIDATDGGILDVTGSGLVAVVSTSVSKVSARNGGLLFLRQSAFAVLNGVSVNNSIAAEKGGLASLDGVAQLFATELHIDNSQAQTGGVVHISGGASASMRHILVRNATALGTGGVAFLSGVAHLELASMQANLCVAQDGGFFGMTDRSSVDFDLVDARSVSAIAAGGFVYARDGVVFRANRVNITEAIAVDGGVMAIFNEAAAFIDTAVVLGVSAQEGASFAKIGNSASLSATRLNIVGASAGNYGGAFIIASNGQATVANSSFVAIAARYSGGLAFLDNSAMLTLVGVRIDGVVSGAYGGVVTLFNNAMLSMDLCDITAVSSRLTGGFADVNNNATLVVTRSNLTDTYTEMTGGAIAAFDSSHVFASKFIVSNSTAPEAGGFLIASNDAQVWMDGLILYHARSEDGGAFALMHESLVDLTGSELFNCSASNRGGVTYVSGLSTFEATGTAVQNASAMHGGVLFADHSSTLLLSSFFVLRGVAFDSGGCIFAAETSSVRIDGARFDRCAAGVDLLSAGVGGVAYIDVTSKIAIVARVVVASPSAVLGPGFFSEKEIGAASRALVTVEGAIAPSGIERLLPGWESGGIFAGVPASIVASSSQFDPTTKSLTVVSGGVLPAFKLTLLDDYGNPISTHVRRPLALSLTITPLTQTTSPLTNGTAGPALRGDIEHSFGPSASVNFDALYLYALPGTYTLGVVSPNMFLYGIYDSNKRGRDLPETFGLNVTVSDCAPGFNLDNNDGLWECTQIPSSSDATPVALIVAPAVVAGALFLACLFGFFRWRSSVRMLQRSRATHEEFIAQHASKQTHLAMAELMRDSLEIIKPIGEGEFGRVFLGRLCVDNGRPRMVAVKQLKEGASFEQRCDFLEEATVMRDLFHPHVVSLCGIIIVDEPMSILLEFVPHGDLLSFVRSVPSTRRNIGSPAVRMLETFGLHIASGMAYLAQMRVVHRDLAARNCMVGQDAFGEYLVKVADFGLSGVTSDKNYYRKSGNKKEKLPLKWMAPEAILEHKWTEASDCWAYGVTMWEMFSFGQVPYADIPTAGVFRHIRKGNRLERPRSCAEEYYIAIIAPCFLESPEHRPSFSSLAERIIPDVLAARKGAAVGVEEIDRRTPVMGRKSVFGVVDGSGGGRTLQVPQHKMSPRGPAGIGNTGPQDSPKFPRGSYLHLQDVVCAQGDHTYARCTPPPSRHVKESAVATNTVEIIDDVGSVGDGNVKDTHIAMVRFAPSSETNEITV